MTRAGQAEIRYSLPHTLITKPDGLGHMPVTSVGDRIQGLQDWELLLMLDHPLDDRDLLLMLSWVLSQTMRSFLRGYCYNLSLL